MSGQPQAARPPATAITLPCRRCGADVLVTFGWRTGTDGSTRAEVTQITQGRCRCPLTIRDAEAMLRAATERPR